MCWQRLPIDDDDGGDDKIFENSKEPSNCICRQIQCNNRNGIFVNKLRFERLSAANEYKNAMIKGPAAESCVSLSSVNREWKLSKIARNKIRYETVGFIFTFCLWLTRIAALINWSHLAHGQGLHLIVAFIKNANINHVVPHLITILSAHCFRSLAICFVVVAEHTFNAEHFLTRFHRSR